MFKKGLNLSKLYFIKVCARTTSFLLLNPAQCCWIPTLNCAVMSVRVEILWASSCYGCKASILNAPTHAIACVTRHDLHIHVQLFTVIHIEQMNLNRVWVVLYCVRNSYRANIVLSLQSIQTVEFLHEQLSRVTVNAIFVRKRVAQFLQRVGCDVATRWDTLPSSHPCITTCSGFPNFTAAAILAQPKLPWAPKLPLTISKVQSTIDDVDSKNSSVCKQQSVWLVTSWQLVCLRQFRYQLVFQTQGLDG